MSIRSRRPRRPTHIGRSSSSFRFGSEALEPRRMLSAQIPQVIGVSADNRGEMTIMLDGALVASTVNKNSVQVYTAGPDRILGNADDTRVPASVRYVDTSQRIVIRAQVEANDGYRVKLVSSRITTESGLRMDGEFYGRFSSGDGLPGGNFECQTKNDRSATPLMRLSTSAGVITLRMFREQKPISVENFFSKANAGLYDSIFFTRSIPGFIVQAGSLQIDEKNNVVEPDPGMPIVNEFLDNGVIPNTRGTVAFAKQPGDPNSATNQFFFNLADNSANLDHQNGGFTVFAEAYGASSLATMDAIAGLDAVALHNPLTGTGVMGPFAQTRLTDVPVHDAGTTTGQVEIVDDGNPEMGIPPTQRLVVTGSFNPYNDLVFVRRTAILQRIAPL